MHHRSRVFDNNGVFSGVIIFGIIFGVCYYASREADAGNNG
jgi:hypothetical protein